MTISAVLFDFYGTLARATRWVSADEVLNEHGYTLTDKQRMIYFAEGGPKTAVAIFEVIRGE